MKSQKLTLLRLAILDHNWITEIVLTTLVLCIASVVYYFKHEPEIFIAAIIIQAGSMGARLAAGYYRQWKALQRWKRANHFTDSQREEE